MKEEYDFSKMKGRKNPYAAMKEIERIIKEWDGIDTGKFIKAIERYVIKARIEECSRAGWYWSECKDKRIAELKKGLK